MVCWFGGCASVLLSFAFHLPDNCGARHDDSEHWLVVTRYCVLAQPPAPERKVFLV